MRLLQLLPICLFLLIGVRSISKSTAPLESYIQLEDATGIDNSSFLPDLEEKAQLLSSILPEDLFPQGFKIFDFGYYLHHPRYKQNLLVLFDAKKAEIEKHTPHYLLIGKESSPEGLYESISIELVIPTISNTCYQQEEFELIVQQTINNTYSGDHLESADAIGKGIDVLTDALVTAAFCCSTDKSKSKLKPKGLGSCSACGIESSTVHAQMERMQFAQIESINDVLPTDSGYGYDVLVPDENGNIINLVSEVSDFVNDLTHAGHESHLDVMMFDFDDCSDLLTTNRSILSDLERSGGYLFNNTKYHERLVVIKQDSVYSVYYRFDFTNDFAGTTVSCSKSKDDRKILPALAARWLVKRALMAGANVMLDIAINITIEKIIGGHETWGEAWDHTELSGWGVFVAAAEGATAGNFDRVIAVGGGCIEGGIQYFKNIQDCDFQTDDFFNAVMGGCGNGLIQMIIGELGGRVIGATVRKFQSIAQRNADELAEILFKDLKLVDRDFYFWMLKGKFKVRAWGILFKEGDAISQALRRDVVNLEKVNSYITNNISEYNYIKSFFANSPTSNHGSYVNRLGVNEGLGKHFDDFTEVEIVNSAGTPSGEFDGIDMLKQAFMEDKSAAGINTINPNTGQPYQTASQWAQNQIYNKTQTRINNLSNAVSTRPTVNGSPTVPSLKEIQGFKKLFFRIDYSDANLIQAVEDQLVNLRAQFPGWEFSAHLGG